MSDSRLEFEQVVVSAFPDSYDFGREAGGDYSDEALESMWWAWQASRQALDVCEPEHVTPLYTHPASADNELPGSLADSYRNRLFECQDVLNNLRSEYHNKMAEMESEIEEMKAHPAGAGEWIKRSERLPEESDGDCDGTLWVYDNRLSKVEISDSADVIFNDDYTHWMPTNLVRPEPPEQEQGQ